MYVMKEYNNVHCLDTEEFYDDYILEVSTYQIDSLKTPKKSTGIF